MVLIEANRTNGSELNEGRNTTPTKRKIKRVARAKGGLQDEMDEVGQWRQHPPEVGGSEALWTTLPAAGLPHTTQTSGSEAPI